MLRAVLIELALFLTPFALYYLLVKRARRGEQITTPWLYLSLAGLLVAGSALVWYALTHGSDPTGQYTPAVLKDGKIVPGHIDPADKPAQ